MLLPLKLNEIVLSSEVTQKKIFKGDKAEYSSNKWLAMINWCIACLFYLAADQYSSHFTFALTVKT